MPQGALPSCDLPTLMSFAGPWHPAGQSTASQIQQSAENQAAGLQAHQQHRIKAEVSSKSSWFLHPSMIQVRHVCSADITRIVPRPSLKLHIWSLIVLTHIVGFMSCVRVSVCILETQG